MDGLGAAGLVLLLVCASAPLVSSRQELKLLHVLSANKFYVPDYNYASTAFEAPRNLTYEYFLRRSVEIPNSIKTALFNLGSHLRSEYGDTHFIDSLYFDEVIRTQTTEFPTSIMAAELIHAGLWPPVDSQIWKEDLLWQPVPFDYKPAVGDALLLGTLCPSFKSETAKVLKHHNLNSAHVDLLNLINSQGQMNLTDPIDVSLLYLALENSRELNNSLPEWATGIYPGKDLLNLTLTGYELLSKTPLQKQLNGGSLLKKIINDSKDYISGKLSHDRQVNLYSGDERNLMGVLTNLNLPRVDLPAAGSALIFELYAEANEYFIKVAYFTGASNQSYIELPGCQGFCPIAKFEQLVSSALPADESSLCKDGSVYSEKDSSSVLHASNMLLTFLVTAVTYESAKLF